MTKIVSSSISEHTCDLGVVGHGVKHLFARVEVANVALRAHGLRDGGGELVQGGGRCPRPTLKTSLYAAGTSGARAMTGATSAI